MPREENLIPKPRIEEDGGMGDLIIYLYSELCIYQPSSVPARLDITAHFPISVDLLATSTSAAPKWLWWPAVEDPPSHKIVGVRIGVARP